MEVEGQEFRDDSQEMEIGGQKFRDGGPLIEIRGGKLCDEGLELEFISSKKYKNKKGHFSVTFFSAVWTGLEPATPCVTGMYSNQLNYQTVLLHLCLRRSA